MIEVEHGWENCSPCTPSLIINNLAAPLQGHCSTSIWSKESKESKESTYPPGAHLQGRPRKVPSRGLFFHHAVRPLDGPNATRVSLLPALTYVRHGATRYC
jgi:hypothetical protein